MNQENKKTKNVAIGALLASRGFQETRMILPCALGVTDEGKSFLFDLTKMPHVLIGGSTGIGKSNTMHAIMVSLLQKKSPEELKLVLIDPKRVEFTDYETLSPHYLARLPYLEESIITDVDDAVNALNSLNELMHERYMLLQQYDVMNIKDYNNKYKSGEIPPQDTHGIMPYYVVVIDEVGAFMLTAGREFELPLVSLAQLSRAVGIHIIISSHRPLPSVFPGSIKANFPCRIAFRTATEKDSRIIMDNPGAEQLSGIGNLLFACGGTPILIHGAYVDVDNYLPAMFTQLMQQYDICPQTILPVVKNDVIGTKTGTKDIGEFVFQYADPLFEDVVMAIVENQFASTSFMQRRFGIGYNRATRLLELTESAGVVSAQKNDTYIRDVLISGTNELMHKLLEIKKKLYEEYERKLFI